MQQERRNKLVLTILGPILAAENPVNSDLGSQLLAKDCDIVVCQNGCVECVLTFPWAKSGVRTSDVILAQYAPMTVMIPSPAAFVFGGHPLNCQSGAQAARSIRSRSGVTHHASEHLLVCSGFQHDFLTHTALLA